MINNVMLIMTNVCFVIDCGAVVNNILTSPGYPYKYPPGIHCIYWVPIPEGTTLIINFEKFYLYEWDEECR